MAGKKNESNTAGTRGFVRPSSNDKNNGLFNIGKRDDNDLSKDKLSERVKKY